MLYELTLTLRPCLYKKTPDLQFHVTVCLLYELLEEYQYSMIAELTQEHNVHYHGIIELKDSKAKNLLLNKFRPYNMVFGKKSCRPIDFEETWKKYLLKDYEKTKLILKFPIITDRLGVFVSLFPDLNQ